ncbi:SIR2 family protein [Thiorhodococcus mannitoliphagus]|uniref:SIR2 family protein n=1 Tax=Thiorhodococcus mannitoliphagus TaxID=329406 RepID=A0A6P1DZV7_9GAMM|nr:SIR2 family protein [Thiorhodococcus mannitoliphagus]NEX22296.1 SIR2 family protein [Thiorhodococcus mannitoliphagus]
MTVTLEILADQLARGELVPYLGPGALQGVVDTTTNEPMPADSDSLIIAMNNGKPMSPRLMWEFPRAAMDVELKRGRSAVHRFLNATYAQRTWTRSPLHDWIQEIRPPYVIDINRDLQLQDSHADQPHTLIRGIARTGGTDYRFRIHAYDGEAYREVDQAEVDPSLPVLFKPMGSPKPDETYIASDADYVDYLTELMGGFGAPAFVKRYRVGKQYLFLGLRFLRDTERMVMSDLIYAAGSPGGWALIPDPTEKERRFLKTKDVEIIEADWPDLLAAAGRADAVATLIPETSEVGC